MKQRGRGRRRPGAVPQAGRGGPPDREHPTFSAALRERREALGLSAADLARIMKLEPEAIEQLECGLASIRDWPWGKVERLRCLLGWSPGTIAQMLERDDRLRPSEPLGLSNLTSRDGCEVVFQQSLEFYGGFTREEVAELTRFVLDGGCSYIPDGLRARYLRFLADVASYPPPQG